MEGLRIKMFNKIRKVLNEQKVDFKDLKSLGDSIGKTATSNEIKKRFEKIIRMSGFSKSLRRVNATGFLKMIAYYSDDVEAKEFAKWANKQFRNTKLIVVYKDLSVGESKAGVIFDFTRM